MPTTADLVLAREAMATHIYLCEDRLNHAAGYELLDEAMNVAFEVGRYGAQLDKERAEAMGNAAAARADAMRRAAGQ